MRVRAFLLFSVLLVLNGCKTKPEDVSVPENILSEDEMTAILADMHTAEAFGYMLRIEGDEKEKMQRDEYSKIFAIHEVSLAQFEESYQWYLDHPLIFNNLYDEVIEHVKTSERFAPEHLKKEEEKKEEKKEDKKGKEGTAKRRGGLFKSMP